MNLWNFRGVSVIFYYFMLQNKQYHRHIMQCDVTLCVNYISNKGEYLDKDHRKPKFEKRSYYIANSSYLSNAITKMFDDKISFHRH